MNEDKLLKQMLKRDPVRGAAATRRQVLQGIGAGALALGAGSALTGRAQAADNLAMLTWDGYVDPRVLDGFTDQYGNRHRLRAAHLGPGLGQQAPCRRDQDLGHHQPEQPVGA